MSLNCPNSCSNLGDCNQITGTCICCGGYGSNDCSIISKQLLDDALVGFSISTFVLVVLIALSCLCWKYQSEEIESQQNVNAPYNPLDKNILSEEEVFRDTQPPRFGVAFSGGGIRAAAIAAGIMQGLSEANLLPQLEYLSCVSGGGFTGASYMTFIKRYRNSKKAVREMIVLMRKNSNYLFSTPIACIEAVLGLFLNISSNMLLLVVVSIPLAWFTQFVCSCSYTSCPSAFNQHFALCPNLNRNISSPSDLFRMTRLIIIIGVVGWVLVSFFYLLGFQILYIRFWRGGLLQELSGPKDEDDSSRQAVDAHEESDSIPLRSESDADADGQGGGGGGEEEEEEESKSLSMEQLKKESVSKIFLGRLETIPRVLLMVLVVLLFWDVYIASIYVQETMYGDGHLWAVPIVEILVVFGLILSLIISQVAGQTQTGSLLLAISSVLLGPLALVLMVSRIAVWLIYDRPPLGLASLKIQSDGHGWAGALQIGTLILGIGLSLIQGYLRTCTLTFFRLRLQKAFYYNGADVELKDLPERPIYLCNTTLNGIQLPAGESMSHCHFLISKYIVGSAVTGYRRIIDLGTGMQQMTLSMAMGLSGAAVSIEMGQYYAGVLQRFYMELLSLSLGDWIRWWRASRTRTFWKVSVHLSMFTLPFLLYAIAYPLLSQNFGDADNPLCNDTQTDRPDQHTTWEHWLVGWGEAISYSVGRLSGQPIVNATYHDSADKKTKGMTLVVVASWTLLSSCLAAQVFDPLLVNPLSRSVGHVFGLRCSRYSPYLYLSDGGHFENLGIYQLLKMKCRVIVVSDASCDPDFLFEDLTVALRQAASQFGLEFMCPPPPDPEDGEGDLDRHEDQEPAGDEDSDDWESGNNKDSATLEMLDRQRKHRSFLSKKGYLEILYRKRRVSLVDSSDESRDEIGRIFYIKSTVTPKEDLMTKLIVLNTSSFPHHSTVQQWFTPEQFDAYCRLGFQLTQHICPTIERRLARIPMTRTQHTLPFAFSRQKERRDP
eukprot:TRINITY_DN2552_c0_g1_i1.p1 TRINITY_DN2552_c0_g1~~TRINITY_DN2552_c0_g1_i1.p1  ORF type:complete len:1001 (+),score=194.30 TRINITY_DN2552_c0_g1_i1:107-3109(+)